jgi:superfamily II DNA helicase RecQ
VLSEADFAVFAKLRELRKSIAEAEGVPPYAVFTNEHLASMVRGKLKTLDALGRIEGVGPGRVDRYGARFLALLEQALAPA